MQIKKQLEDKIKKEMDLQNFFYDKINKQNKENDEIVKRIKIINPQFEINNIKKRKTKSCIKLRKKNY